MSISGAFLAASVICLVVFGLRFGIDFTGGSLIELRSPSVASTDALRETVAATGFEATVQKGEGDQYFVRLPVVTEEQHQSILAALQTAHADTTETQYTSVGPTVGNELKRTAVIAVIVLLALIGLYVAWAFRKVSAPVQSWKYGLVTLVAAFHDVIIPLGVFAVLGKVWSYQVDAAFVAAILTILGYSINDTIVVFDRTRENLLKRRGSADFRTVVNDSINETFARSINTTLAVLLPLLAIFFLGGETTRSFSLALIVGILAGAYSSIFVASPMLVRWYEMTDKKGKRG